MNKWKKKNLKCHNSNLIDLLTKYILTKCPERTKVQDYGLVENSQSAHLRARETAGG